MKFEMDMANGSLAINAHKGHLLYEFLNCWQGEDESVSWNAGRSVVCLADDASRSGSQAAKWRQGKWHRRWSWNWKRRQLNVIRIRWFAYADVCVYVCVLVYMCRHSMSYVSNLDMLISFVCIRFGDRVIKSEVLTFLKPDIREISVLVISTLIV